MQEVKLDGQLGLFEQIGIQETRISEGEFAMLDLTSENPHWIESTPYENVSDAPTEENLTYLSDILEKRVSKKYYLSKKACEGILRRAEERGKQLPDVLRKALKGQAESSDKTYVVNQGAGKSGASVPKECSPTLDCAHGGAPAINSYGVIAKGNGDAFIEKEQHGTLTAGGGVPGQGYPCAMTPISVENHANDSRTKLSKDNKVQTLSSRMGTGGNNEPMVLEPRREYVPTDADDKCGAICADDLKGAGNQYVGQGKCVVEKVAVESHPQDSRVKIAEGNKNQPLSANMENDPSNGGLVLEQECVACVEGNGTRPSHKGSGINDGKKSYTLNTTEEHAVVTATTGKFMGISKEKANTLEARDYKDPQVVAMSQNQREEVRDLEDKACALTAEQGTHNSNIVAQAFRKTAHAKSKDDGQGWEEADVSDTLNVFDQGETRTPTLAVELGAESRVGSHAYEDVSGTLRAEPGDNQMSVVLNDQGGKSMGVEREDVSPSLRAQDHGHSPIVCDAQKVFGIGSKDSNAMKSDNPHSGIYEADTAKTLDLNGGNPGCNQGGMAVVGKSFGIDQQGGKGQANYTEDVSPTLAADSHGTPHAVCLKDEPYQKVTGTLGTEDYEVHSDYAGQDKCIVGYQQNKYDEYRADNVGATLKAKGGNCHGGSETLIADFVDDNNKNAKHQQDELNDGNGVARTLAAGTHGSAKHLTNTILPEEMGYTVRRLTPTECSRLQGLPDGWAFDLKDPNPSEEEIDKWYEIFETYRKVITHSDKPKSREAVKRFLQDPYSDSAAYKMFGNGIALWCAVYVLAGIVWADKNFD